MVEELNSLLKTGGFALRKWASNEPEVLASIPQQFIAKVVHHELATEENNTVSTLGMLWTPTTDSLQVQVRLPEKEVRTKREVLANIARIYDPLGFLDPVKMKAKLYMQQIWKLKDQQGNPWSWDK
ncbi:uncharacterized protein LOC125767128 [Anopheles funestus]|uniref:uncharacterized protein LOC125767128 n=1 Tax=Anopheles funestus TaxID=62324 RepID=UPI0020C5B4FB|nr:uncharacterized protein LOC125767128 [Anopheles funestus]